MPRYIVKTASAQMPKSCWGIYRRVGVLKVADGVSDADVSIDPRRRGVLEVVQTWEKCSVGTTARCAYQRALAEAEALAAELNAAVAAVEVA